MPNIKSQIKRDRQNKKRTIKNKAIKSKIKTVEKKLIESVNSKDAEGAKKNLSDLYKHLDKAVRKSAVNKNYSAHKKSKRSKLVNSLDASAETPEKTD